MTEIANIKSKKRFTQYLRQIIYYVGLRMTKGFIVRINASLNNLRALKYLKLEKTTKTLRCVNKC